MKEFFLIVLFSGIFYCNIHAQENEVNFQTINQKTYELYLSKSWDELITTGKKGLRNNIDFYYLRMRIGIAYYNKRKYINAIKHFEKAIKFNSVDELAKEYLYHSYINANREMDAEFLSKHFSDSLKKNLEIKKTTIKNIYLDGGPLISNNDIANNNIDIDGDKNIKGEYNKRNNGIYLNIGLTHRLGNRFSFYQGIGVFNIAQKSAISINNVVNIFKNPVSQIEYYINGKILLAKGFIITSAFHFVNSTYSKYSYISNNIQFQKHSKNSTGFIEEKLKFNNSIYFISVSNNRSKIRYSIFGTYSDFENQNQIQVGGAFTIYPWGNINFYYISSLIDCIQNNENNFIVDQCIGVKIFTKLWFEGFITYGNLYNYNEKNGFIVYNIPDLIKYKAGMNMIMPLSKKIELSINYQYFDMQGFYNSYINANDYVTNYTKYINQSIIGGIKWKL